MKIRTTEAMQTPRSKARPYVRPGSVSRLTLGALIVCAGIPALGVSQRSGIRR